MQDASVLEKFRRRLERRVNEYNENGSKLQGSVQGLVENFKTLCDGIAFTANRYLPDEECRVEREMKPYNMSANSFVLRHVFFRGNAQTSVDVTFSDGAVSYSGEQYHPANMSKVEEAVADRVLEFYMPR